MPGKVDCCPKCGLPLFDINDENQEVFCLSDYSGTGPTFRQIKSCRIRELEAENNQLRTVALTQSKDTSLDSAEVIRELKAEVNGYRKLINNDGSLTTVEEHADILSDAMSALDGVNRLVEKEAGLEEEILRLKGEVERLTEERVAIQNKEQVLTCAFCGQAYPPGTPASNHQALTDHVRECPKHPIGAALRSAESKLTALQGVVRDAEEAWQRILVDLQADTWPGMGATAQMSRAFSHASLPAPSPWVSVKDRFPGEGVMVGVFDPEHGIHEDRRLGNDWEFAPESDEWCITLWIPIPPCADSNGGES